MDYEAQFIEWVSDQIRGSDLKSGWIGRAWRDWSGIWRDSGFERLEVGQGYAWNPEPSRLDPRKLETAQGMRTKLNAHNKRTKQVVRLERMGTHWLVMRIR